ncbi:CLUMA_CG011313, isoform A [Clunio marinus]|uniref:CLUMA_CG011313, isoform A n=1 Tax=Clunio marinus TaxID=568069 RepID=A0A1J1ICL4_9DIPT|nr:CLUMA_CG011313, isoform A [Clunio marinus]
MFLVARFFPSQYLQLTPCNVSYCILTHYTVKIAMESGDKFVQLCKFKLMAKCEYTHEKQDAKFMLRCSELLIT